MKMELAVFKDVKADFVCAANRFLEEAAEYVRISEYVTVDFPDLDRDELVKKQIDVLREQKNSILATAQAAVNDIDRKIGDLQAITHNSDGDGHD